MMNLIDAEDSAGQRRFGVGHFDLVVIDEAHRSVYQKYGAIFSYFDSLLVGLTATPRDEIDRNTYGLFDLELGMPTDEYGLDQAVEDRFLVPFEPISVPLQFPIQGIHYDDLSEAEKAQWDLLDWEEGVFDGDRVEPGAVNQWLFNANTVDQALEVLMTRGQRAADTDRIGKTILFARNHLHAVFIQDRFDHHYPHLAGKTARVIDNKIAYAQTLIDEFSDPAIPLDIAISVDMLDTGIDVPEIVNLVFFKPVRSRTKFWQMVGRGTRLCPDLFGPDQPKQNFLIFDCCQNLEFFLGGGGGQAPAAPESLSTRLFKARLALIAALDQPEPAADAELAAHRERLVEQLQRQVAGCPADNFMVRPQLELVERFSQPGAWQALSDDDHALLASTLAPLPSTHATQSGDTDPAARQFDLLLYRLQLARLRQEPAFNRYKEQLEAIASLLEERHAIPMVAAQLDLIQDLLQPEWWQDVAVAMLEEVRSRLRNLVGLIEKQVRQPVYVDFEDQLGELQRFDFTRFLTSDEFTQFRLKARDFLRQHSDHLAVQRLRRSQPLTPTDLEELETFLLGHGIGSVAVLEKAKQESKGLGLFIRELVGLDRGVAKELFADFLAEGTHTSAQIQYINEIINELTSRGVMDPSRLYATPYNDFAPTGPEGLFSESEVTRICALLTFIRERAEIPMAA
jgi:type I restriction enzyme R subunit